MSVPDFIVVGSSGGGGTIAWLLAKAGFRVVVLEHGPDFEKPLDDDGLPYNTAMHDEYRFRIERPDPKRRPRGDYNTFRTSENAPSKPFKNGWTGTVLGGGSVLWGTWAYRALPIDFRLATLFDDLKQSDELKQWGYSVPDWPISYGDMEPYYNVAEALFSVCGDRKAIGSSIAGSGWYQEFSKKKYFREAGQWQPAFPFPSEAYPETPVGYFARKGIEAAGHRVASLPTAIVNPGVRAYETRAKLHEAASAWKGEDKPAFWRQPAKDLWSDRVRDACNMCGFCGEYLCWGGRSPKSGTWGTTLKELRDLREFAEVRTDAKAYEVVYDERLRRATGVRYLDVSDPSNPKARYLAARYVIVSCGAVQSARLLLMSGPPGGLGNRFDQVGRYATFHLFGFGASFTLPAKFQGSLRGEIGMTGNTTSFGHYFVRDDEGRWLKAGTMTSTAKKNPLENADGKARGDAKNPPLYGMKLLGAMEAYNRTLEVRLTADDLPMARNRVTLDPDYVDEYGLPVARITRDFGEHENRMFRAMQSKLTEIFDVYKGSGVFADPGQLKVSPQATVDLVGDHQMGTCRMGEDPAQSVLDPHCRIHDVKNVFVVDSSFMPTGFGLNPMITVVANALRVGTWIVDQAKRGRELA